MEKQTFVMRKKYHSQILKLSVEQKAQLLDKIFEYQTTWEFTTSDPLLDMLLSIMVDEWKQDEDKYTEICEKRREYWKLWWAKKWNQNAKKNWEKQAKQPKASKNNQNKPINDKWYMINDKWYISSVYISLYDSYYWKDKWIDVSVCDKLINTKLKQWMTLDDIQTWVVLYNCECRLNQEYRYVKKFENRIKWFQPLTDEQKEETLRRIIKIHKEKKKSDPKYSDSLPAKTLWKDLCDTFWSEKVNSIFKSEAWWNTILNFT